MQSFSLKPRAHYSVFLCVVVCSCKRSASTTEHFQQCVSFTKSQSHLFISWPGHYIFLKSVSKNNFELTLAQYECNLSNNNAQKAKKITSVNLYNIIILGTATKTCSSWLYTCISQAKAYIITDFKLIIVLFLSITFFNVY